MMISQELHKLLALFVVIPALVLPSLVITRTAHAAKDTITIETSSNGSSRDKAIAAALANAVIKIQGKLIPANTLVDVFLSAMREERKLYSGQLNDARLKTTRLSTAAAFVQDYQILESSRQKNNGLWQVRISAEIISPAARLAQRKESLPLSLVPFQFMGEEEAELADADSQAAMRDTLIAIASMQKTLATNLDGHAGIKVHDIPANALAGLELASESPGRIDWPKLANTANADFFVTTEIEDFTLEPITTKKNQNTGRLAGRFVFNYRVITKIGTEAVIIKTGRFITDTNRNQQLRALSIAPEKPRAVPVKERMNLISQEVARQFGAALLRDLLPATVLAQDKGTVIISPGGHNFKTGDKVAVLGTPIEEKDAALGLRVRQEGARLALLEITSGEAQRITARVLQGNPIGVQPGALLRRVAAATPRASTNK